MPSSRHVLIMAVNAKLLQGIFPTQGSNPGLLHCRQILYQLSYQESPDISSHFSENIEDQRG